MDALSQLPEKNKKFIVKLSKFLSRVCLHTTKYIKGNIFGPEMDDWLTSQKRKSSQKSLCGRGKNELEIVGCLNDYFYRIIQNCTIFLSKNHFLQVKYFIFVRMSENFGNVIGYRNNKFYMIKFPGIEANCKM